MRKIITTEDYQKRSSGSLGWIAQRVTGFLLAFILLTHLFMMHVHLGDGPEPVSAEAMWERFSTPGMQAFYLIFLYLAVWHGANGLKNVLDDYLHGPAARWFKTELVWLVGLGIAVAGTLSVFAN